MSPLGKIVSLLLLIIGVCALTFSCGAWTPEVGISNVSGSIGAVQGCACRVTVTFSDNSDDDDNTYYYWVGLMNCTSDGEVTLIAHSTVDDGFARSPGFSNWSIPFDLTPEADLSNLGRVFATAQRTENPAGIGGSRGFGGADGTADLKDLMPDFPPECCPVDISLYAGGSLFYQGGDFINGGAESTCVFISELPAMPVLEARADNVTGQVNWSLTISYERSGRTDLDTYQYSSDAANSWYINNSMGIDFRGGQATLSCYSVEQDCTEQVDFAIRGYNETEQMTAYYIDNLPSSMWYWKYVAKHESYNEGDWRRYNQFNVQGMCEGEPDDVLYTPNASGDGGFGLFMLTWFAVPPDTARVPNAQELWSWHENVSSGTDYLAYLQSVANDKLIDDRSAALVYFGFDQQAAKVPPETLYEVTFEDWTDKVIEQAVALKRYNGESGGQYCEWDDDEKEWDFNRLNTEDPPFNYVARVCEVYP